MQITSTRRKCLTLRHRWRWHERVEHISWSDCNHVCTTWYIISASDLAFCSLAIPRGRLPICIFQLQFIGLIREIAARWISLSTYDMGNKLRALLRLVDQLFDSDSDPVGHGTSRQRGVQVMEARRPIVRLRQRSRRPWNIQTAWRPSYGGSSTNCSTPTAIPSARGVQTTVAVPTTNVRYRNYGIRRKTTTGIFTDTTRKHFFIGFQFPR
jgi:hypothetical protein